MKKKTIANMRTFLCAMVSLCTVACCLTACNDAQDDDNDGVNVQKSNRKVMFLSSKNGPGDNGYNDMIMKAEMSFAMDYPEIRSSFIGSLGSTEMAGQMLVYSLVRSFVSPDDSTLVVLNGSEYGDMVRGDTVTTYDEISGKVAKDMRVLVFEDDGHGMSDHYYTFRIQRYGASYVAARLLGKKPALVVAGMRGEQQQEDALQGFIDGYKVENPEGPIVAYLADDFTGFDSPDLAVHICDSVIHTFPEEQLKAAADDYTRGLCIFPLAGGSNVGMYGYVHNLPSHWDVEIIGMDVMYNYNSNTIPFSLVIPVSDILLSYLTMWVDNTPWPVKMSYGIDINFPITLILTEYTYPRFLRRFNPDGETSNPLNDDVVLAKLQEFIDEAIVKEKEYVQKLEEEKK